jgi:hypothetical protein
MVTSLAAALAAVVAVAMASVVAVDVHTTAVDDLLLLGYSAAAAL